MKDTIEKAGEVHEQMKRLDGAIKGLSNHLGSLEGHLDQFMSEPTLREDETAATPTSLCDFASYVRDLSFSVEAINSRITDLLSRLEI